MTRSAQESVTAGAARQGANACTAMVPPTRRGRNTRNKLVEAGRDIFSRVAFADVRITDITALAGVASGTFYTYFDSKEEIFREIAARVLDEMEAAPTRDPNNVERDPRRDIEYATRQYFLCCAKNARIARSIEELQSRDAGVGGARRDVLLKGVRRVERWIRMLQDQGICDQDVDPWPTALALNAMNVSVAYDQFVHREEPGDVDALVSAVARVWRRSVGLEATGQPLPLDTRS